MVESAVERRLAAILAADVVGYSKLMGKDEAGTLVALKKLRTDLVDPRIGEHKGRVFKATGDGLLVEFPSVVNAVACAVDIQRAMAARNADLPEDYLIKFRIGVNLGDVIIEGEDVFGDGVNVAARLEGIAPPGGIAVSGTVHDHLGNRLNLELEDLGEQQLKNIDAPVRVFIVGSGAAPIPSVKRSAADKPSIAVLPFDNMSGDPGQQYLSDGITEDIITELARFRGLSVTARHASFHYRGRGMSIAEIARQLGAAFVVEGSVRKSGGTIRVTAQLIDAVSGNHIWAERYDRDSTDIFAVQDEVVSSIVTMLEGRMVAASAAMARRKPTSSWSAYDCVLQGRELCNRYKEPQAIPLFSRAISIDPQFAAAHAWLAIASTFANILVLDQNPMADAHTASTRALELDANDATSQYAKALVLFWSGDHNRARFHFDRAMALNPADILIKGDYANWQRASGNPIEALATIDGAYAQGPYVPDWFGAIRGHILFDLKCYQESVEALESLPIHYHAGFLYLAAARAYLGDKVGAAQAIAKVHELRPGLGLRDAVRVLPYSQPQAQEHFLDGLRKAGLHQ